MAEGPTKKLALKYCKRVMEHACLGWCGNHKVLELNHGEVTDRCGTYLPVVVWKLPALVYVWNRSYLVCELLDVGGASCEFHGVRFACCGNYLVLQMHGVRTN